MKKQNKQNQHTDGPSDDSNVLNYLLQHVRGLSPTSLSPVPIFDDDSQFN